MSSDQESTNLQVIIHSCTKKVRKVLTSDEKEQIIELHKQGYYHQDLADQYRVGRSTITKLLLKQERIDKTGQDINQIRKQRYSLSLEYLESVLIDCFCDEVIKNEKKHLYFKYNTIIAEIVDKAQKLAIELDIKQFKGSNYWFNKFRRKYNIKFQDGITSDAVNNSNSPTNILKSNVPINYEITLDNQIIGEQLGYYNNTNTVNSLNNTNFNDFMLFNNSNQNGLTEFNINNCNMNINIPTFISDITCPIQYIPQPVPIFNPISLNTGNIQFVSQSAPICDSTSLTLCPLQHIIQPVNISYSIQPDICPFQCTSQPDNITMYSTNNTLNFE
ncbi:hypothetical protein K502DRAFT_346480 [Neoconidiobolus thromboides FSU 785]|nr:hypothetical protein K502DRAFT_346480 [Neoconidiobolus thromboides FSU 785]